MLIESPRLSASFMASTTAVLRSCLTASGLTKIIRKRFDEVTDTRRRGSVEFTLSDTLMAALAMFQFKSPSLLQFERSVRDAKDTTLIGNLKRLFWIASVPCDSQMRSIIDEVSPASLRRAFRGVHSVIQRARMLEDFKVFGDKLVVSIDGTGLFSSTAIHCPQCGVKKRKKGKDEYYHQLLAAVIVSPNQKTVLPLDFEPIIRSDGETKDCCERNAAKRLIPSIARQYAKRKLIVVEDALAANGPHVKLLREHNMDFVIGAKPAGSAFLFAAFDERQRQADGSTVEFEQTDDNGVIRGCRFGNDLPINASHPDVRVNLMEFWEVDAKGVVREWSWITSLPINSENAFDIAAVGRSRWGIENQVFNTLKNQGYRLEHNFGHGKKYLSSTLAGLMLLAFLSDQVQEHACPLFKAARKKTRIKTNLWAKMQTYLQDIEVPNWETLWRLIAKLGPKLVIADILDSG